MQTSSQLQDIKNLIESASAPAPATETAEAEPVTTDDLETSPVTTEDVTETTDLLVDTPEEDDEPEVTDETTNDETDEETDEAPVTEAEADGPSTLNELAEAIEVDMDYLYGIKIAMPDGAEPLTISELKNERQEQIRNTQRLEETINEQKEALANTEQQASGMTKASQERVQLMGVMNNLQNQYNSTDWAKMEDEDPGEAALLQQKFQNAYNGTKVQLGQLDENEKAARHNALIKSAERTYQLIPEWKNDDLRTTETTAIEKLLADEGLTPQQVSNVSDPFAIKLLRELTILRAEKVNAQKTVEKIRKVPKVLKSKARVKPNLKKTADNLVERAKQTGDRNDKLAATRALLGFDK